MGDRSWLSRDPVKIPIHACDIAPERVDGIAANRAPKTHHSIFSTSLSFHDTFRIERMWLLLDHILVSVQHEDGVILTECVGDHVEEYIIIWTFISTFSSGAWICNLVAVLAEVYWLLRVNADGGNGVRMVGQIKSGELDKLYYFATPRSMASTRTTLMAIVW